MGFLDKINASLDEQIKARKKSIKGKLERLEEPIPPKSTWTPEQKEKYEAQERLSKEEFEKAKEELLEVSEVVGQLVDWFKDPYIPRKPKEPTEDDPLGIRK